jgi:hypothetical protein
MTTIAATGFAIILLAGLLQGLFALPMKFARGWNYENIWLIFAATGLVIFPWMLTAATVPHLPSVYRATPTPVLLAILGFGLCWGAGATLTGLGVRMLGIGLGLAIILGLSASVGSLIPLLVLTPEKIHTYQGHIYVAGTAIMLIGIAFGARAGYLRERETAAAMQEEERSGRGSFLAGLMVVTAEFLLRLRRRRDGSGESPRRFAPVVLQRDYRIGDDRWVLCQSCLLRLSAAQELDGWPLLVSPSAQELDLRRSHGSFLVRRPGSLWTGNFARWRFWNGARLAAVDGHDHHHQQSGWLSHRRVGGNQQDETRLLSLGNDTDYLRAGGPCPGTCKVSERRIR